MMLLYCGDVVGKAGRRALKDHIPGLRDRLDLDFVVVNGENAAHGFGITPKICTELFACGVDVITSGNHIWDQRQIMDHIVTEDRLLRPHNYPATTMGSGLRVFEGRRGQRLLVLNLMGKLFMPELEDPFVCLTQALDRYRLGRDADAILVDIHAEATSEKMAVGHVCDGRASLVVGSHSHIPTADTRILPGGTAYQTDAGMCGDYDSVIGMVKKAAVDRFLNHGPRQRLEPAEGEATLCAVYVETDDASGLATRAQPLRLGGQVATATI